MEWNIDDRRWNQRYVGLDSYKIEHGEIKERITNPVLEINTQRLFQSISAVSNNLRFDAATCGKGDPMQPCPVWHGGPEAHLTNVHIIRR